MKKKRSEFICRDDGSNTAARVQSIALMAPIKRPSPNAAQNGVSLEDFFFPPHFTFRSVELRRIAFSLVAIAAASGRRGILIFLSFFLSFFLFFVSFLLLYAIPSFSPTTTIIIISSSSSSSFFFFFFFFFFLFFFSGTDYSASIIADSLDRLQIDFFVLVFGSFQVINFEAFDSILVFRVMWLFVLFFFGMRTDRRRSGRPTVVDDIVVDRRRRGHSTSSTVANSICDSVPPAVQRDSGTQKEQTIFREGQRERERERERDRQTERERANEKET